jgi:hypothetical protein
MGAVLPGRPGSGASRGLLVIRRSAFWALDRLRGSRIGAHLQDRRRSERDADYLAEHTSADAEFRGAGIADSPLRGKARIRNRMEDSRSRAYRGRLSRVSTSGSHGTPFVYYQGHEKRARKFGDLIHHHEAAGYSIGSPHVLMRATSRAASSACCRTSGGSICRGYPIGSTAPWRIS